MNGYVVWRFIAARLRGANDENKQRGMIHVKWLPRFQWFQLYHLVLVSILQSPRTINLAHLLWGFSSFPTNCGELFFMSMKALFTDKLPCLSVICHFFPFFQCLCCMPWCRFWLSPWTSAQVFQADAFLLLTLHRGDHSPGVSKPDDATLLWESGHGFYLGKHKDFHVRHFILPTELKNSSEVSHILVWHILVCFQCPCFTGV